MRRVQSSEFMTHRWPHNEIDLKYDTKTWLSSANKEVRSQLYVWINQVLFTFTSQNYKLAAFCMTGRMKAEDRRACPRKVVSLV